jgi:hypothetical protein
MTLLCPLALVNVMLLVTEGDFDSDGTIFINKDSNLQTLF